MNATLLGNEGEYNFKKGDKVMVEVILDSEIKCMRIFLDFNRYHEIKLPEWSNKNQYVPFCIITNPNDEVTIVKSK